MPSRIPSGRRCLGCYSGGLASLSLDVAFITPRSRCDEQRRFSGHNTTEVLRHPGATPSAKRLPCPSRSGEWIRTTNRQVQSLESCQLDDPGMGAALTRVQPRFRFPTSSPYGDRTHLTSLKGWRSHQKSNEPCASEKSSPHLGPSVGDPESLDQPQTRAAVAHPTPGPLQPIRWVTL